MKLISLNLWGGKMFKPLKNFIRRESATTDIFCFQEVLDFPIAATSHDGDCLNLLSELEAWLPDFQSFFVPMLKNEFTLGMACFIRKNFQVTATGDVCVFKNRQAMQGSNGATCPRLVQHLTLRKNKSHFSVGNFHGLWIPNPGKPETKKDDTEERLKQSNRIVKEFIQVVPGPKILCGDFNLSPNTQSIKILEDSGLRNLIKDFNITSTRSDLYLKKNRFADYILVSPEIHVTNFSVPNLPISDHLPMVLEFTI